MGWDDDLGQLVSQVQDALDGTAVGQAHPHGSLTLDFCRLASPLILPPRAQTGPVGFCPGGNSSDTSLGWLHQFGLGRPVRPWADGSGLKAPRLKPDPLPATIEGLRRPREPDCCVQSSSSMGADVALQAWPKPEPERENPQRRRELRSGDDGQVSRIRRPLDFSAVYAGASNTAWHNSCGGGSRQE
jgi:hypothetical protein